MNKTIATTARLNMESPEELNCLVNKAKEITGVQVLSTRQIASNMFEAEVYLEDVTDLWLLGMAVGKNFPKIDNCQN